MSNLYNVGWGDGYFGDGPDMKLYNNPEYREGYYAGKARWEAVLNKFVESDS